MQALSFKKSFISVIILNVVAIFCFTASSSDLSADFLAYKYNKMCSRLSLPCLHNTTKSNHQIELGPLVKSFQAKNRFRPKGYAYFNASNADEVLQVLSEANKLGGNSLIELDEGTYQFDRTIQISVPNIIIRSKSGNPYKTILLGVGMRPTRDVRNLFKVYANGFVIDGLLLSDAPNHLIQIAGEQNVSGFIIRNSILQDSYEQMIKVSYDFNKRPNNHSSGGVIKNNIFRFTKGIADNYYTGGIDAIGAKDWLVEDNIFRDIASPKSRIAQYAVHFWVNSSNNRIINNVFIDNDRAIGLGMSLGLNQNTNISNTGGEVSGNVIYHTNNDDKFADAGIVLEQSPNTLVEGNLIFMAHLYPNAIEYRYPTTKNVFITNNQVNKLIVRRDNGTASLNENELTLTYSIFRDRLLKRLEELGVTSSEKL